MFKFKSWSLRHKLLVSMLLCLVTFMLISVLAGVTLTRRALEKRVVHEELPAVMAGIRADVQREIAGPLNAARSMADNHFLLQWEAAGQPDDGLDAVKHYTARVKALNQAASVSWVSSSGRKYINETGLVRVMSAEETWLDKFLAGGQPFALNLDKDKNKSEVMLFINARFDAGAGRIGSAGLGLSLNVLADKVKGYRVGDTGEVLLARPDGTVIVHRDPAKADGTHRLQELPGFAPHLVAALFQRTPYSHTLGRGEGGDRVIAASFVPELDLYVVADVPRAELLAEGTRAAWTGPLIAGLVGGALALLVIVYVGRAIAAPVGRAAQLLGEIADGDGDLRRRLVVESGDEVGQLADAFNRFIASLQGMVTQVRTASDSIATATSEVASGNLDLSSRTEQTSSSLQQTAAAMCQLTEQVQSNASNTHDAEALAQGAKAASTRGQTAMARVEATMGGIDASSRRIGDIIGVIDGIAFQTNILALNAAVEAARAGEQGRGFAVVASEVRNLAKRSADAAKEVRGLIVASMEQAQAGSQEVKAASNTMRDVVDTVGQVSALIDGISGSTHQQSIGISEVNTAVAQLDAMTQQNAALVEQGSAAAESLREQARLLSEVVGRFKLA